MGKRGVCNVCMRCVGSSIINSQRLLYPSGGGGGGGQGGGGGGGSAP